MLGTLINLFNGKKYNIMRQRVDSNKFDLSEFYIGVLIVALIIFLLPTLAIYYFADFLVLMLKAMIIQLALISVQILITHWPTYLLLHTIWNPYTLPSSFMLESDLTAPELIHIRLKRQSIMATFSKLKSHFARLMKALNLRTLVMSILKGGNLLRVIKDVAFTLK